MSIQLAYDEHPGSAEKYRQALRDKAARFGFTPEQVDGFEQPMLVRILDGEQDRKEMARLVRLMNQNQTQGLNVNAEAVSRGRLVSEKTLGIFSAGLEAHNSLAEYLSSDDSRSLIDALFSDGVLEDTQRERMINNDTGKLTDDGKRFVQLVLRGRAVPNFDVLDATLSLNKAVMNKIDRIV